MSWADNETDIEKILKILKELIDALNAAKAIGSSGPDAAAWESMTTLLSAATINVSVMQAQENLRRIKVNQILQNINSFLVKTSQLK